jgi:signal transduction histidine kinase
MGLSVKQKILLSLWLITFMMLALAGILASVWFTSDQSNRLDDFLTRETRGFQELINTFVSVDDRNGTHPSLSSPEFSFFLADYFQQRLNRPLPYKTTMGVFDTAGKPVQLTNEALNLGISRANEAKDLVLMTVPGPPSYRVAVLPLSYAGRPLGTVRLACITVTLGEVWSSFLSSLMTVLSIVFLAFGTLGTILIHWSLRAVREMSTSAQDISDAHLDLRLVVPPGRDEIATMAETLNNLIGQLERDFQFEEALVGQLSHELRTPLTILRGRNEVALDRKPSDPVKRLLEDNLADIDNIVSLLNTLLNLARLDSRMETVAAEPCDLQTVLRELIDELEPLWDEKQIHFRLSLGGKDEWELAEPLTAVGDSLLLRQVFLNLLTNAYKYTPAWGEIGLTVDAGGTRDKPTWRVVVTNPGPPIPEESLELVFKRFYRVEAQHPERFERASGLEQPGFGLGLSIAKSMVELQNGRIRAFNPEQGGAAFEVILPRYAVKRERSRV